MHCKMIAKCKMQSFISNSELSMNITRPIYSVIFVKIIWIEKAVFESCAAVVYFYFGEFLDT